jgi:predicted transcriptional regulator
MSTGSSSQISRMNIMRDIGGGSSGGDSNKKANDIFRLEEKVQRVEKELDEATSLANEKYDKYTECLYKRVADECELTNYYLEFLKIQKQYHKQAYKKLDMLIPAVKDSLASYTKKPVFGCSLTEYIYMNNQIMGGLSNQQLQQQMQISPVIRKLVEGMCKQNVFNEEGIFRVAGSRVKMNCLIYAINAGYLDYLDVSNDFDIHCLASVLKQYIRELPDSILCNELYDSWIAAIK